jgi:hypothetical protein
MISVYLWTFVLILNVVMCAEGNSPTWLMVFLPVINSILAAMREANKR